VHVRRFLEASLLAGLLTVSALAVACGGDDDEPAATATATRAATSTVTATRTPTSTPTTSATSTATPESTAAPGATATPEESTGVPGVDAVIAAVLSGDTDEVVPLVELRSLACGPQQGAGSPPPCPQGEPDGTMVSVLPVATCEGEWRPESSLAASFEPLVDANPELYAVYGMPTQFQALVPDGQYVAVFTRDATGQGRLGAGVIIAGDAIAGLWFGCGATADQIVPPGTSTVLPPRG